MECKICGALRDLYHACNLKNVKNTYVGVILLLKVSLLHGCLSRFLNCTNGTKSHKLSHNFFHTLEIFKIIPAGRKRLNV